MSAADDAAQAPGEARLAGLAAAGFTTDDVNQYQARVSGQMAAAGFRQDEINNYWGTKTPDMSGIPAAIAGNDDPSPANPAMRKELVGSYQRGETKNPGEFVNSAMNTIADVSMSAASKLAKDEAYLLTSTPQSLASDIIQNTINLPVQGITRMGGAAYQKMGGELSVPAAEALTQGIPEFGQNEPAKLIREAANKALDYQPKTAAGEVTQATIGAAPYLLGGEGSLVRKGAGALAAGAGSVGGQKAAAAMGFGEQGQQVGAIVGGAPGFVMGAHAPEESVEKPAAAPSTERLPGTPATWESAPKAQDFPNAAAVVNGPKAETEVSQVLRNIYAEQGIHPMQVVADAQSNPTIAQDLAALRTPDAYQAPTPATPVPSTPEPEPAEPVAAREARAATPSSAYQMVSPDELKLDPQRFQYKASDEKGVTGALAGAEKWEPALANPITAYRDTDGQLYVVNGHQRTDLAQRAAAGGQEGVQIPARIFDAADGYTPEFMRTLGAYQNIAEGSGSAIDAAKVMREPLPEQWAMPGLPPKSQLVQQAHGLAALDPQSFGMVVNDVVPPAYAAEVGRAIQNPQEQLAAMSVLAKSQPANVEQARLMVQDIKNSGFLQGEQTTLFGDEHMAQSLFSERARILDGATRQLRQLKNAFGTAINQEGALTEAGNVLSSEANQKARQTNENLIARIQVDATRRGELSDALSDAARKLKSGQPASAAIREFLNSARELDARPSGAGVQPGDAAGGNGAAQQRGEQTTIPGTEPITDRQLAERRMEGRDRADVVQKPADDGLFDTAARNQQALFQRPTYYSQLERSVEQLPQAKASPEQWAGIIKNLTQRGVKQEEIDWSGVQDWLKEQKGAVTKDQLMQQIRQNAVEIAEVKKGSEFQSKLEDAESRFVEVAARNENLTERQAKDMAIDAARGELTAGQKAMLDPETLDAAMDLQHAYDNRNENDDGEGRPKYETHTLPGGKNYREMLLMNPPKWWYPGRNDAPSEAARTSTFKSSHYDEPNILAHVRFNDRTGPNGEKILHLEEVQSDWHQEGREKGYTKEFPSTEKLQAAKSAALDAVAGEDDPHEILAMAEHDPDWAENIDVSPEAQKAINEYVRLNEENAAARKKVPDAPFKKTWPELAIKRMLRYAAEEGYDKLTWTTGEQQGLRYDLRQHIDTLEWKKGDDGYEIRGLKNGRGLVIHRDDISPQELVDMVGKNMADQIHTVASHGVNEGTFKGVDLAIGGEGMKGFYDKIMPAFLNKYAKKWGARVGETEISGGKQVGPERVYKGTEPTLEQVQQVHELSRGSGNEKVSPITGQSMGYTIQRVAVENPLRRIVTSMKDGRSFSGAMEQYGTDEIAEIFGGEMVKNKDAYAPEKVHSIDITPQMRVSVMGGQPLFSRGLEAGEVPENAVRVAPGVAATPKTLYTEREAEVAKAVNDEVQRLLGGRGITSVVQHLYSTGERGEAGEVKGFTEPMKLDNGQVRALVYASLASDDVIGTARHEAIHALRYALTPEEWGTLETAAEKGGWLEKHNIAERWRDVTERAALMEEAIAEEFAENRRTGFDKVPAAVRPIFQKIAQVFDAIADRVRRIFGADAKAQDIFSRIDTGEVGQRGLEGGNSGFQTPEEKILSKINVGGTAPARGGLSWNDFYKAVVDKMDPVRRINESMDKGMFPTALNDSYKMLRNLAGNYGRAQHFIEQGTYDFGTYKNTGKSLEAILAPVKDDVNGFRAYAAARRAIELDARGIKSGMDITAAKDVITAGASKFEPVFKELNGYQASLLKYLKDAGVLNDKQVADMQGANKSYVPFYRVMDDENFGAPGGAGRVRNPIKRIKGSERDIVDPLESIVRNTYSYVALAERNAAVKSFFDLASKQQDPDMYFTKQPPTIRPTKISEQEMNDFLQKQGIQQMPQDTLTVFRAMKTPLAKDEIGFFDKGNWTVLKVDPDVAEAFNGTPTVLHSWLFKMMQGPAKALRYGIVTPEFIIRHLERNALSSTVIGEKGGWPLENLYRGIFSYLNKDEAYEDWLKSGGKKSALSGLSRDDIQDQMRRITGEEPQANFLNKAWNIVRTPFDVVHAIQQNLENMNNLGAYKTAMKGLNVSKDNIVDAGYYSRNVTPDPSRIGSQTGLWNAVTALANTEIQHTAQLIDALKKRPLGTLAKGFAFVTLPTIINWAMNHNTDQWKEAHPWERDAFWIIPAGGYTLRIPKPFLMGFLFATVPERILDKVSGLDKNWKGAEEMVKDLFEQATPNTIPNALSPLLEQLSNHSFFRNQKLVPDHLMQQLPEYRYSEYTSELTKALGQIAGKVPYVGFRSEQTPSFADPLVIDNYLRAWTGTMGTYVKDAMDFSLRKAGVLPDPILPARTLADIPFVRAFVVRYPDAQAASIQQFQDDFHKMSMVTNTFKALVKQGQIDQAKQVMQDNPSAFYNLSRMDKALSEQNQMVRAIYKNPSIKPDEKRQLIDGIYYQMISISRAGNNLIDAIQNSSATKH